MKRRLIAFLILAWTIPAGVAELLGWRGIWGSGSALADFLIPFPTTGGALHVPSIVASLVLISARNAGGGALSTLSRPLLVGMALAGVVLLLDREAISLALATDMPGPRGTHWFTDNPLGLFLLSDGLLAQLWLARRELTWTGRARWVAVALAMLLPPFLAANVGRPTRAALMTGTTREGPTRGDGIVTVYSSAGFDRTMLEAALNKDPMLALPPDQHIDTEDQAVYFFDSLKDARDARLSSAKLTWCRYEDGTAAHWYGGEGDCFSDHVSFSEQLEKLHAASDPALSPNVRVYAAMKAACTGITLQPEANFSAISSQHRCYELPRMREVLLSREPPTEANQRALQ